MYFNCINTLVTKHFEEIQPRDEQIRVHDHLDCRTAPLLRLPFSRKISDRVYTNQYSPHLEGSTDRKKEQAHLAARFNHTVNNLMLLFLKMLETLRNNLSTSSLPLLSPREIVVFT